MKQNIRVYIKDIPSYDLGLSIEEFISKFQEIKNEFPNSLVVLYGDEANAGVEIYEDRLETDEEYEDRLKREAHWKEQREKLDRETYERLKAKFG